MNPEIRRRLFQLGSFGLAGILLWLALRGVDFGRVADDLRGADYRWLIPLAAVTLASHWIRAYRWRLFLEAVPERSFSTGWYALKLRRSEVQPAILPRLGRPARYRVRLHLAEELFRMGLFTREELRARWEAIRDLPGPFDPKVDEARDLIRAAQAVDVLTADEAEAFLARVAEGK